MSNSMREPDGASPGEARTDRRSRRRQETIEEILEIAVEIMGEDGVNGLTFSEVARRLGVQPPSLYKYFDSLMALYDRLFERGQSDHLEVMQAAMDRAAPGIEALQAGLEASGRWCLANAAIAQLMFWRPIPRFEPSPESMAPSLEMVEIQRRALTAAAAAGQLGPGATSEDAVYVVSVFVTGTISQALANEPGVAWGNGRFSPLLARLIDTLPLMYPPATGGPDPSWSTDPSTRTR